MHPDHNSVPELYGVSKANSSRYGLSLWGKNQFNSTFPLSLCLYMRDKGIDPVSVMLHGNRIEATDNGWKMWEVVGKSNENPCYQFETLFDPYARFSRNEVDNIDLIVLFDGIPSKPLEIKLTVVPDSGTAKKKESEWAPEIVMRPVSSAHAMMGVAKSLLRTGNESIKDTVINAIKPAYNRISS